MATRQEARVAKDTAKVKLQRVRGLNGIGLIKTGTGYGLKVNLETDESAGEIPDEVDGVPVEVEIVGTVDAY